MDLEAALSEVLARLESGEQVSREWLQSRYPECWRVLQDALHLDLSLTTRTPPLARFGRYRVLRELGRGGMGTVYLAEVEEAASGLDPGDRVALKVIHPHLLDGTGIRRLVRESQVGRRIDHPNVVRTLALEVFERAGVTLCGLVMEHVEGRDLRALMRARGRVSEPLCRSVGRQVAAALAAVHAAGAVHRDLKPENVILAQGGTARGDADTFEVRVKVTDLGVAWLHDARGRLSTTGNFVGSLLYAAPEQFQAAGRAPDARQLDGRTDLYALGLVLYELAAGAHPFAASDLGTLVRRQIASAPRPLRELNPALTPFFEEVVGTLVERDPEDRFPSADELLRVLAEGETSEWWARRTGDGQARRRRRISAADRETGLHGRDAEIAALREAFESARRGTGSALLLEGEAGIGKSRLLDEFLEELRGTEPGTIVLSGRCRAGVPGEEGFLAACRQRADEVGVDGLVRHLASSPSLARSFSALLARKAPTDRGGALTPDAYDSAAVRILHGLSAEAPTVVVLDDLHSALESRRVFSALAHAVSGARALVLGAARPELPPSWTAEFARLGHARRLHLEPLPADALMALVADALGSNSLAEELARVVGSRSDGNPWFALQILRDLRERGPLVRRRDGTWERVGPVEEARVPGTVAELVGARLDGLPDQDRELLELAACCGFEFDPGVVARALGRHPLRVLRRLANVARTRRLVRPAGRVFAFEHHLLHEALYAAAPEALREEYHGRIADALEAGADEPESGERAVTRVHHLLRARRGDAARARLPAAFRHLALSGRYAEQCALTEKALELPGLLVGQERCDMLLERAECLHVLGRREEERPVLEEALRLADEGDRGGVRARARAALARHLVQVGRRPEARSLLERGVALACEAGDRAAEGRVLAWLGLLACDEARHEEARRHHERVLELTSETGDEVVAAMARGNLGIVCFRTGDYAAALVHFDAQLDRARALGHRWTESNALGNLCLLQMRSGQMARARAGLERALRLRCELGHAQGRAHSLHNLSIVHTFLGDLPRARECSEAAHSALEGLGESAAAALSLQNLGTVEAAAGDAARAESTLRDALDRLRGRGHAAGVSSTLYLLGTLYDREGRADQALGCFEEAGAAAEGLDYPFITLPPRLATAALRRDPRAARAHFEAAAARLSPVETMEALHWIWRAGRDERDLARARALLEEFVEFAPPECRGSMIEHVPLHRAIADGAWSER